MAMEIYNTMAMEMFNIDVSFITQADSDCPKGC